MEQSWSLEAARRAGKNRTCSAEDKKGADAEVAQEDQLEDENKEAACLDWSRREDIQVRTVKGRLRWTGRRYLVGIVRGRPNWFGSLLPEVQKMGYIHWCWTGSPTSERKVCLPKDWKRCLNGSSEQASTLRARDEKNRAQLVKTSWKWSKAGSSKQLEEQERTAQAKLQTKRGAYAEVAPEDQLEDKNKEADPDLSFELHKHVIVFLMVLRSVKILAGNTTKQIPGKSWRAKEKTSDPRRI
ncbi:multidrug resistance protein [Dorcoceras hygrometricum]|uniref:Multidrug resistance protein n=1 Tax=Dorcoceras hygrometricum TaxID=472368 RepID=A0A2Z7CAR9_9LAMI|nr:multidrug resistance protein [Dorcoceras hygrometricum]